MKPRDLVLDQIHHRETSPIPYTVAFEGDLLERLDRHYGGRTWRERLQTFLVGTEVVQGFWFTMTPTDRDGVLRDLYGSLWRKGGEERPQLHLESPALATPSLDGYRWPAPERYHLGEEGVAKAQEFCRGHKNDHFLHAALGWGLFERSWGIRGFENALMDAVSEPDFYEALLDRITDHLLADVDFTCRSLPDIDAVLFTDDWGDQRGVLLGPERWRTLLKPRWARIYETVHGWGKLVISHCCGSIAAILPDLIQIGLDVLESVQPEARDMNPYELKQKWGDKITFWGCLGSQSPLAFGTPTEVGDEVRRLRSEMGKGGGFILAPAKPLQQGTPIENAVALVEALAEAH